MIVKSTKAGSSEILMRILVVSVLWVIITQAEPSAWVIGIPAILLTVYISLTLNRRSSPRISIKALPAFIYLFITESLKGGIDVARLSLSRRITAKPVFTTYQSCLKEHQSLVLFLNCISLFPGTLAVDVDDRTITMHLLDASQDPREQLVKIERAISHLYPAQSEFQHD